MWRVFRNIRQRIAKILLITLIGLTNSYHVYRSVYTVHLICFKGKNRSLGIVNKSIMVLRLKNLGLPVKMVFLNDGHTCITHVHDSTPRPLHNNVAGATQYTRA